MIALLLATHLYLATPHQFVDGQIPVLQGLVWSEPRPVLKEPLPGKR